MKRHLLFPLIIFTLFPLSAAKYHESNALMQERGVIESLSGSGYELETDGDVRVLYLDGAEVRRVSESNGTRTVTEGGRKTTYVGTGQPVRIVTETADGVTEELYEYSPDGVLKRVITVRDGVTDSILEYDYSPSAGLTSFRRDDFTDPMYIGRDSYTFIQDGEDMKVSVLSDLILRESASDGYSTDGDVVTVREGGDVLLYSASSGLLGERRSADGTVTKYVYDNRELISEETSDGSVITLTEYLPGVTRITVREGDEVKRIREKRADGITETVSRNGQPYALVTYDSDGKRVLKVEVL